MTDALKHHCWLQGLVTHLCRLSGRWTALPNFPDYNKWGFSLVALNNTVYVTGRRWGP